MSIALVRAEPELGSVCDCDFRGIGMPSHPYRAAGCCGQYTGKCHCGIAAGGPLADIHDTGVPGCLNSVEDEPRNAVPYSEHVPAEDVPVRWEHLTPGGDLKIVTRASHLPPVDPADVRWPGARYLQGDLLELIAGAS